MWRLVSTPVDAGVDVAPKSDDEGVSDSPRIVCR
jgi:hypothetical protein